MHWQESIVDKLNIRYDIVYSGGSSSSKGTKGPSPPAPKPKENNDWIKEYNFKEIDEVLENYEAFLETNPTLNPENRNKELSFLNRLPKAIRPHPTLYIKKSNATVSKIEKLVEDIKSFDNNGKEYL